MTLPVWPSAVPCNHIDGSMQVGATTGAPIASEMNAGTTRRRRKFTLRMAPVSFDLLVTNAQAATLQTFHETTLGDGSARFTLSFIWRGALVTRTAVFTAPPAWRPAGPGKQRVALSFHVEAL